MLNNRIIKKYYQQVEDYDWVEVSDKIVGPESFMHRAREKKIKHCIDKYIQQKTECLDVGCGTGLITRYLPEGAVGLDINPRNMAKLKKHAPHIRGIVGDAEKIPFKNKKFDIVICTEMIEHLLDKDEIIVEIYRVLKTSGLFIGSVPSKSFIWKLRFLSMTYGKKEPYHYNFSMKELKKLLNRFSILEMDGFFLGSNIYFVAKK